MECSVVLSKLDSMQLLVLLLLDITLPMVWLFLLLAPLHNDPLL